MSVKTLSREEVHALVDNAQLAGPPVTRNFFDVFGTTGCLLDCENGTTLREKIVQHKIRNATQSSRREGSAARKQRWADSRGPGRKWFNANEILASATQGCGSCSTLRKIILQVFFPNQQDLPDDCEYFVSRHFEISQREPGAEESVEVFQLFQPPGMQLLTTLKVTIDQ
jgi:hypothetical protein